jgi:hypothetical protein
MPLQKQVAPINFQQGLDLKTDPLQIPFGKFFDLENSIFRTGPGLTKRNGFGLLSALPDTTSTYLTTFGGNLTAIGTSLYAYSSGTSTWSNRGSITPVQMSVLPTIRANASQTWADTVVASNGLACTVYTEAGAYKYTISDATTGQAIQSPTTIPAGSGAIQGSPRVFIVGRYFFIVISNLVSAVNKLQYLAIPITQPTLTPVGVDITTQYTPATTLAFDGVVANNGTIYLAWNGSDGGGAIRVTSISSTLVQSNTVTFASRISTLMSVTCYNSTSTPIIYVSFYNSGTSTGYSIGLTSTLATIFSPVQFISSGTVLNLTSTANSTGLNVFYEVQTAYSYGATTYSNLITKNTVSAAGTVGASSVMARSVGLASKAFYTGGVSYMLGVYQSTYQPSYFLLNASGGVVAKLAYSNGAGYLTTGLPSALADSAGNYRVAYLFKTQITPVNKTQGATTAAGIYAQIGVNLASFGVGLSTYQSAEIGANLHVTGGLVWAYDGASPVEQNFNLWPDNILLTGSTSGGTMTAQQYYYQVTYEWSDNQGNIHQSAPSVPLTVTTTGSTSSVRLDINTLRLTYKTTQPVKIVIWRWSAAQQTYYQVTSVSSPTYNSTTTDSIVYTDTVPDSSIIGNRILYTTGGIVEDIGPPAASSMTLYRSRLWIVDAEDENLLWFSKQVIEDTPVEMSDLFTYYVAPTQSAQGPTGGVKVLSTMDDKLILFKKNALYYVTGNGPDNTGANNDLSDPVFITGTAGCTNPQSIVMTPNGLMYQSDKGIWILGRNLQTQYIGAPVEAYNSDTVLSALTIPGTNQVRFTLASGTVLMYDYFFDQWGTFVNVPGISATLFQDLHTYLDEYGRVLQETPNVYLDNGSPVLMKFTTSWLSMGGLQGFERAYQLFFVGTFYTPHKLTVGIAYDYNGSATQSTVITAKNYSPPWGGDVAWGSGTAWGGASPVEQWRLFLQKQKTQAIQVTVQESFDGSYGTVPGLGLSLSGMALVYGLKSNIIKLPAAQSVG